ncbi:MAG: hypothetical protein NTAFB09_19210 [Nitrosospira sp.]
MDELEGGTESEVGVKIEFGNFVVRNIGVVQALIDSNNIDTKIIFFIFYFLLKFSSLFLSDLPTFHNYLVNFSTPIIL